MVAPADMPAASGGAPAARTTIRCRWNQGRAEASFSMESVTASRKARTSRLRSIKRFGDIRAAANRVSPRQRAFSRSAIPLTVRLTTTCRSSSGFRFRTTKSSLFKPFHERCDRARFQRQSIGDTPDALRTAFPQCAQNEILRVGDFQGVEQRLVSTADRHAGAIQRKAELMIQCDFIHGHSPGVITITYITVINCGRAAGQASYRYRDNIYRDIH